MVISMLKIRRPLGRLIFNMGIAIPGKTVFLIETAPRSLWVFVREEDSSELYYKNAFVWNYIRNNNMYIKETAIQWYL